MVWYHTIRFGMVHTIPYEYYYGIVGMVPYGTIEVL
jgi:hypothetical protein